MDAQASWMSFPFLVFGALLLAASLADVVRRRVPNLVVVPLAAAGLSLQAAAGDPGEFLNRLLAGAIVLALLFGPWAKRLLGGGDLKLAVAAALWLPLGRLPLFLVTGALAGGVVAVAVYAISVAGARREVRQHLALAATTGQLLALPAGREVRRSVPYAVAISAGAVVAMLWRG